MSTSIVNNTKFKVLVLAAVSLLFLMFFTFSTTVDTSAAKDDDLRAEASTLEEKIAANEAYIGELEEKEDTLQVKVDQLEAEIAGERQKIQLTQTKIESLKLKIEETIKELERQKGLLRHALVTLYKEGNVTTIELLASSDSYSDFINQQEYLTRIKDQIQASAKEVEQLKESLDDEKAAQDALLLKLEAQKEVLSSRRNEQQRLLEQTQGEEARYQAIAEELREQRAAVEASLDAYLASLINNSVSLGPVSQGEVIGGVGNTGFSTGSHLHYKINDASSIGPGLEPTSTMNQLGFTWPVSGGGVLTQSWGCGFSNLYPYYNGCAWHDALDIAAPEGTPVLAAGSGQIILRGCLYAGTRYSNYGIIIDHENGYYSTYMHMKAPDDSAYNGCRANTYY